MASLYALEALRALLASRSSESSRSFGHHFLMFLRLMMSKRGSPLQFYMVGTFFSNWLWTAGHLQSNSISDGYELTTLPSNLTLIKALLILPKHTTQITST